jgi:arylsulfatase A-like enzyme
MSDAAQLVPTSGTRSGRRPNVVLVVLDDTGWSDLGCFGSEIDTPTIDRLAAEGLRFTDFHVTPLCAPTRASLLTGRNHHRVGMGWLPDREFNTAGRRGRVSRQAAMLPAVLRANGYGTYLAGKWHLTPAWECSPAGPFGEWPTSRGFDRFYGFLAGAADQYEPDLVQGTDPVDPPCQDGYHLSADLVDRSIRFIADHLAFAEERPFYLHLAFGATHTPHQVGKPYVDKYERVFTKGWDQTRLDRFERQRQEGLVPPSAQCAERNWNVRPWDNLTGDERQLAARLQAAYAGFLEYTDRQLGRLVGFLADSGQLQDTLILVLSDNGASDTGGDLGHVNNLTRYDSPGTHLCDNLARIADIGGPDGPGSYSAGWGMASNTPYPKYKEYVDAGGVRAPLIAYWPVGITDCGAIRQQFMHSVDVMPTILDVTGIPAPDTFEGIAQLPVDGASYAAVLRNGSAPAPRDTQYFEIDGFRAIRNGKYKAIAEHKPGTDYALDFWHLFDVISDPAETTDLAAAMPGKTAELARQWDAIATENSVYPLDDRRMEELLSIEAPHSRTSQARFVLRPQQSPFSNHSTGLGTLTRPVRFTAQLEPGERDGILIASGGHSGGWAFYIDNGTPRFFYVRRGTTTLVQSLAVLPEQACEVALCAEPEGKRSRLITISIDDRPVATGLVKTLGAVSSYRGRIEVGRLSSSLLELVPGAPRTGCMDPLVLRSVTVELLDS